MNFDIQTDPVVGARDVVHAEECLLSRGEGAVISDSRLEKVRLKTLVSETVV